MSGEKGNTIVTIVIGIGIFAISWVVMFAVFDWVQATKAARMGYGQQEASYYEQDVDQGVYAPSGYTVKY